MNTLPSTSSMRAPDARRMNSGVAPTALNARTGLSTPPGRMVCALEKRRIERLMVMAQGVGLRAGNQPSALSPQPSALSPDRLPDFDGGEIADRRREKL